MNSDEVLTQIGLIIRDATLSGPAKVDRSTRAIDVRGWDSLTHTIIIMKVEEQFGITLPMERAMVLADVGELVDLVLELKGEK